jgi:acetoacetyl-CoA synthetase
MSRGAVVWTPDADVATRSSLARYMRWLADDGGRALHSYEQLWAWSVEDLEGFWASVWRWFDIRATPYDAVLADRAMPGARWFEGTRLNYAEHALRAGEGDGDRVAVVELDEEGPRGELTWAQLRGAVGGVAAGLRERGIGRGDLVAGYLPNCAEAAIAYLACASIGATWSSCAPDLQPAAALDRFGQLRPAALIACDGYRYGGRAHDRRAAVAELTGALDSLRVGVIVVDRLGLGEPPGSEPWSALAGSPAEPAFEALPFDHPLYVLFSSGTTGPPKGIVHGHGGQLLDHIRHHALHLDLGPGDRFSFYTGTGWMVWNWLVAGLLVGSTIVLYDGSPRHPELDAQFEVVARAGATVHGTSAGYLTACAKAGLRPGERHDLSALRAIASTGSPLPPETFHWISDAVGGHVWPVSTSGGTDVCSAFVSGCPLLAVRAGEIQCRCLGAAIDVLDEGGAPLRGEVGELVLTAPLPSMPVRFWDDPDGERYRASYFADFPGIWRHGDWATLTDDGAIVILGRSDSTLNRHGVRIGTAEIYAAVDAMPEIADSLIIGVEQPDGGYWMPLFVALAPGAELDDGLRTRIVEAIRAAASPRHAPDDVVRVPAIPRTHTGKKLEVPIKRVFMGADPASTLNRRAVADPVALDAFVALARERASRTSAA